MPTKLFLKFTILLLAGTTFLSAKDTEKKGEGEKDLKSEIKEYIRHHLEAVSYTHLTLPTKA